MIEVTREGEQIVFNVRGTHKLWAFKSQLEIPAGDIHGVRRAPSALRGWKGWRSPGTSVPGILAAGSFYRNDKRVFWDVRDPKQAVIVDLDHEHYDELVIEVEDPDAVIALLSKDT